MMYGREAILPWEVEHDLGPLESENAPELSIDEVIERMYNLQVQVLDVAAANIKQAQYVQACTTKHTRNAFAVGEKVWRMNPLWSTKLKALRKGPKWIGPYEIVERKGGGNGNYVLKCLSGKNKAKINKSSYPLIILRGMSSGTLTYPMATPVNLSMALTMKMNHMRLVMLSVRFLCVHQWTLMTILCQILQWMNLPCHHMFVHHLCLLSCCMFVHHLMNLLHCCMFIHHLSSESLQVRTPSKLFPGHTPGSSIPPAHSDEPCQLHRY